MFPGIYESPTMVCQLSEPLLKDPSLLDGTPFSLSFLVKKPQIVTISNMHNLMCLILREN